MLTNLNPFYSALLSVVFIVASKKMKWRLNEDPTTGLIRR
jgi:hypothetical protein